MCASSLLLPFIIVASLTHDYVASDEYRPDCLSKECPSVRWVDGAAGEMTEFVLTSSQRGGSENWVSFAFADTPSMLASRFVVDCYDLGGLSQMGASRNSLAPTRTNHDSPADKEKLTNITVAVHLGVYNCTFLAQLPSTASYVIMAEGKLHPAGNTSSPMKKSHGSRKWASIRAYRFGTIASNATAADYGAVASPDDDFASIGAGSATAVDIGSPVAKNDPYTSGSVAKDAAASENQLTPPNAAASKSAANSATSLTPPTVLATLLALAKCSTRADTKVSGYDYWVKASLVSVSILVTRTSRHLAGLM